MAKVFKIGMFLLLAMLPSGPVRACGAEDNAKGLSDAVGKVDYKD